jgi:CheY-like chemotaxis protein
METFASESSLLATPSCGGAARLLVVDDEIEHAEICAALLRRRGYSVAVGLSGRDAVVLARMLVPDLILLDLYMPGVDGFSAVEQMRGLAETRAVPIVIVSATGEALTRRRAVELGIVAWLAKPFRAVELLTCVERALGRVLRR